jgi:hypothetical protein
MSPLLPFGQSALVDAQEFLALCRCHLEVKTPLLYVLTNVPGMGWILDHFP